MRTGTGYRPDRLFVPPQQLLSFLQTHDTPFYLYDEMGLRKTARTVRGSFYWNPGYCQYYAIKANAVPALLQLLRQEGCGVLVHDEQQLRRALDCGFGPEQILVSPCALTQSLLRQALALGCELLLDSQAQAAQLLREPALPRSVGLRFNPCAKLRDGASILVNSENDRAGLDREQLLQTAGQLQARGVAHIGIMTHLASNSQSERYLPTAARLLFELACELKQKLGLRVSYCDLGGGIGLNYEPRTLLQSMPHIARLIRTEYERLLPPAGLDGIPLRTQLGRYLVGRHGILVSRVQEVRSRGRQYAILDVSAAQLPRPVQPRVYQHISVVGNRRLAGRCVYSVYGCQPGSANRFNDRIALPVLQPGQAVALHMAGAYCQSQAAAPCPAYLYTWNEHILPIGDGG